MSYFGFGPTLIVRGEGNCVINARGKRYLNANSCTWNFALGYGEDELIEAANRQLRELPFSSVWCQTHPRAIELAAKLVEISGGRFNRVYLGTNGSEAVETAFKIARQYNRQSPNSSDHGRYKIIAVRESYHGLGYGAMSAAGKEVYEKNYGPLVPGFEHIPPPYCYRCPFGEPSYPDCNLACAHSLEELILEEGPETIAAFILEPIMAEFGVITPPDEYYSVIGEICARYGLLLIADEVTTGFGRAGKLFFSQDWSIQPDILCLGKIISGGYLPLSATMVTEQVYERFVSEESYLMSGSTNSAHPVCAAVGLAAINLILKNNLPANAAMIGEQLKNGFDRLKEKYRIIGDVRGKGLMLAIELVKDRNTKEPFSADEILDLILEMSDRGMLISLGGLRFFPPLTIDESNAQMMIRIVDQSLGSSRLGRKFRQARELMRSKSS